MYELLIKNHFSSAHRLRGYRGKCENLHGHNWNVDVTIRGGKLNSQGMIIDFDELKKIINSVLEEYDHKYLNELPDFRKLNPTTENISFLISVKLQKKLKTKRVKVIKVCVWESAQCGACYYAVR
ncbi:MAG: 6-carboxytetrahydropterin synthase QueD [Candidatus Brocadiia bacterium]